MSTNPLVHVKIYQESRNKKAPKKKKNPSIIKLRNTSLLIFPLPLYKDKLIILESITHNEERIEPGGTIVDDTALQQTLS